MIYLGVDPGANGGIAAVYPDQGSMKLLNLKSATERDVFSFLLDAAPPGRSYCVLEKPAGAPGQRNLSGLTKLHDSVGFLRGLLVARGVPFDFISPQSWQRVYGLLRKDKAETDTAKKNRHKQAAERLFPEVKVTHAVADALLLADFCRRTYAARYGQQSA